VNVYSERMLATAGHHLHVTLTIPNSLDLRGSIALLKASFTKLWNRGRKKGQGPFWQALGAVISIENTMGTDGKWHPHIHALVTMAPASKGYLPYVDLRTEWTKLTGGRQIRVEKIHTREDLIEVLKYSVKPAQAGEGGLDHLGRVEVWRLLSGTHCRLRQSYGCYRGVVEPVDLDEPHDDADWNRFFFRWIGGEYRIRPLAEVPAKKHGQNAS
jgi:hypothetical protein